jgi:hypothetical protein
MTALWNLLALMGFAAAVTTAACIYAEIAGAYHRARWYPAQATVIRYKTTWAWSGQVVVQGRDAIARYTGRDGREHTLRVSGGGRPIGSTVPILVSPRNPRRASVDLPPRYGCLLVVLAVAIACGLLVALVAPSGVLTQ